MRGDRSEPTVNTFVQKRGLRESECDGQRAQRDRDGDAHICRDARSGEREVRTARDPRVKR